MANVNIKMSMSNKKAIKSFYKFKREMLDESGIFFKTLTKLAKKLLNNSARRYRSKFNTPKKGPDVSMAIKNSGYSVIRDTRGSLTILLVDEDKLDELTKLKPTVVKGEVYNLWRLLSAGWGEIGSGVKERGHKGNLTKNEYPLYVLIQDVALQKTSGRVPPYPDVLTLEDKIVNGFLYTVVRHPGFRGRWWFLKRGGLLYAEDEKDVKRYVDKGIERALKRSGMKDV